MADCARGNPPARPTRNSRQFGHDDADYAAEHGDPEKAVILAQEARAISGGDLLADVDSELLRQRHLPAWEEFLLQLTEAWIDAETASGNHAGVLGELRSLVAGRPLAENF